MFKRMFGAASSASAARDLVQQGALLLDVRTPEEHSRGHIAGSSNIPVQELHARIGELGPTERHVVVYCRSGARSALATRMMRDAGYQVTDIGGMHAW